MDRPPTKKMVLSLILIISHNEDHGVDDNVYDSSYNDNKFCNKAEAEKDIK